jgi:hypothetical protein
MRFDGRRGLGVPRPWPAGDDSGGGDGDVEFVAPLTYLAVVAYAVSGAIEARHRETDAGGASPRRWSRRS